MNGTSLGAIRVYESLRTARARGASDVHFGGGEGIALRIDGRLDRLDVAPFRADDVTDFLKGTLADHQLRRLDERGTADGSLRQADCGAFRIHAFRQLGGIRIVIRLLSQSIPTLDTLRLPAIVGTFADRPTGLVLFTGPTGSGKTTALAALIDRINRSSARNIITVEDPVEYIHEPVKSLITHCEIGRDVSDYAEALRGIMRADPDVILVGEMRDRETMEAAMTAAETGHLVFATLHTNDTAQTIDRIVDSFPSDAQGQIRAQLAAVLIAVAGLRLVPRRNEPGRRAAAEILIATDAVRNMIRDEKTHQIRNAITTGRAVGMQTLESHLSDLVVRGDVALEVAQAASNRPAEIRTLERAV